MKIKNVPGRLWQGPISRLRQGRRKAYLCQLLIIFVVLLFASSGSASRPEVIADRTYYDADTGCYILDGNVTVRVKDAEIRAQKARVSLATLEVFADGGISVTQGEAHFSGDSVYVNGKKHHAVINGNIRMEDNGRTILCAKADFNWKTKDVVLTNVTITDDSGQKYVDEAVYNIRSKGLSY